ncbi:hypothetical protein PISMIDRAFT_453392 [Pisolithus microcarpus 441]|uniref:Uncharacterized protein n=1 Tax=Pisolithus microcarpus 441 TaxID=765257 RepID=A0A0C9YWR4_9AGAM|nr:hypothetical protein PISMIDRAFT_453392 [Pisolithus microcarpus 441]
MSTYTNYNQAHDNVQSRGAPHDSYGICITFLSGFSQSLSTRPPAYLWESCHLFFLHLLFSPLERAEFLPPPSQHQLCHSIISPINTPTSRRHHPPPTAILICVGRCKSESLLGLSPNKYDVNS